MYSAWKERTLPNINANDREWASFEGRACHVITSLSKRENYLFRPTEWRFIDILSANCGNCAFYVGKENGGSITAYFAHIPSGFLTWLWLACPHYNHETSEGEKEENGKSSFLPKEYCWLWIFLGFFGRFVYDCVIHKKRAISLFGRQ